MATIIKFPVERVEQGEHENCPRCGAVNGPSERLGSGICNACLSRSVAASKAAQTRAARRARRGK